MNAKKISKFVFAFASVFIIFNVAFASNTQSVIDTATTPYNTYQNVVYVFQPIGTGISGGLTSQSFQYQISNNTGATAYPVAEIFKYTEAEYNDFLAEGESAATGGVYSGSCNTGTGDGIKTATCTGSNLASLTFDPDFYYIIFFSVQVYGGSGADINFLGSSDQIYINPCMDYSSATTQNFSACASVKALNFDFQGTMTEIEGGVPPDTSSRIDTFTYATSTATANITGYWNATTTPYITERLSFWQYSTSLGRESYEQVIATTTGAFNFTFDFNDPYSWTFGESSTTPIYSSFTLNASLDQYDETNEVWPYGGEVIDNIDATSTTISAAVYNASDFISTPRALALYPEYECGITSIMGCIKNAAIWLFYPTQDALDSWQTLKGTLETKAPVGYFYQVKNNIGGLSATSTAAFSLTIPQHLKTYIFDPFDIGISGILWFFFIFHFYKRLKHITI